MVPSGCKRMAEKKLAPAENRTRGSTMATLNFTTKPLAHTIFPYRYWVSPQYLYFTSSNWCFAGGKAPSHISTRLVLGPSRKYRYDTNIHLFTASVRNRTASVWKTAAFSSIILFSNLSCAARDVTNSARISCFVAYASQSHIVARIARSNAKRQLSIDCYKRPPVGINITYYFSYELKS